MNEWLIAAAVGVAGLLLGFGFSWVKGVTKNAGQKETIKPV